MRLILNHRSTPQTLGLINWFHF